MLTWRVSVRTCDIFLKMALRCAGVVLGSVRYSCTTVYAARLAIVRPGLHEEFLNLRWVLATGCEASVSLDV